VRQLAAGGAHTCAVTEAAVFCWGANSIGQLGLPPGEAELAPTRLPALGKVAEVSLGHEHTCARFQDGSLLCWGANDFGQLGDGTEVSRHAPAPVRGLPAVRQAGLGDYHSCALTVDGKAYCWGRNDFGQLGDGTRQGRSVAAPVRWDANPTGPTLDAGTDAVLPPGPRFPLAFEVRFTLGENMPSFDCALAGVASVRVKAYAGESVLSETVEPCRPPAAFAYQVPAGDYHFELRGLSDRGVVCSSNLASVRLLPGGAPSCLYGGCTLTGGSLALIIRVENVCRDLIL
jgi:hypothetical protein